MENDIIKDKPSLKTVSVLRLRATAAAACAAFIIGVVFAFSFYVGVLLSVISALIYIFTLTLYAPQIYKMSFYTISSRAVIAEKGVIFHRQYKIPTEEIEYTVKLQTPIQKRLGVFTVIIYTKGARMIINDIDSFPFNLLKN